MRLVCYADSAGAPGALKIQSNERRMNHSSDAAGYPLTRQWITFTLPGTVSLTAGDYWLGVIAGESSGQVEIGYDNDGSRKTKNDTYSDGASDPFGTPAVSDGVGYAVYATYTPTAVTVTKTLTASYTISVYVTKTLTSSYGIAGYAWVDSSLFDFDSSLSKFVRGVKVDFDPAPDGDGGAVDVYYRLNKANSIPVLLATNITAGTEYMIDQQCHSVGIRCVLKKGTSTLGPTLKRVSVRAAPELQQFRRREFVLDLTNSTDTPRKLRDGTYHPKSGREQANDLVTASQLQTPFSITDRFGTFTGFIDLNDPQGFGLFEIHPSTDEPAKSGAFIAQVMVREV
jgi:hypothetical protein